MNRTRRFAVAVVLPFLLLLSAWLALSSPRWLAAAPLASTIPLASCSEASLNAALALAAADFLPDILTFPPACTLINITSQKQITTSVEIDGGQAVILRANSTNRHFEVQSGGSLTLKGIALTNGAPASGDGGAVLVGHGGSLVVDTVLFQNNRSPGSGGAIAISGLTAQPRSIVNSRFYSNTAVDMGGAVSSGAVGSGPVLTIDNTEFVSNTATDGGGLAAGGTTLWITSTTFVSNTASNYGGGLYSLGSAVDLRPLHITGSEFTANRSAYYAGGMYAWYTVLEMTGSTFTSNQAQYGGGARVDLSVATVANTRFADNSAAPGNGGGVRVSDSQITIQSSEFLSNSAASGGGGLSVDISVNYTSTPTLRDSTFAANKSASGSAIRILKVGSNPNPVAAHFENLTVHLQGSSSPQDSAIALARIPLHLLHATVTGNATGVYVDSGATLTVTNSVLQNTIDCSVNPAGSIASVSYSLFAGATCGTGGTGNLFSAVDALLPLQNNGGSTRTRLPKPGSQIVDSASAAACLPNDQRGLARAPAACDMGAAELVAADPPAATATVQAQPTATLQAQQTATAQAQQTAVSATATAQATTAQATTTPAASQTPTASPTPTASSTPTVTPSPTPTLSASLTPQPGLTPDSANDVYLSPVQRP